MSRLYHIRMFCQYEKTVLKNLFLIKKVCKLRNYPALKLQRINEIIQLYEL